MSEGHLFDPGPPRKRVRPTKSKPRLRLLPTSELDPQVRLAVADGGGTAEASDGLPARLIAAHSEEKAWTVRRYLDTVSRAMARKWFDVNYAELFCGPGLLLDRDGQEHQGSPLEAVSVERPFERYVFCDADPDCTSAVDQRLTRPSHSRVDIFPGDANDPAHLERVIDLLDPAALVIVYLDPAKPNLHFSTIERFARLDHVDLIINLPFINILRSLSVGSTEGASGFLNHPAPLELLRSDEFKASRAIREHFLAQLRELGLDRIERKEVRTSKSPHYDLVLASRNDKAPDLWRKANRVQHGGQIGLDLS